MGMFSSGDRHGRRSRHRGGPIRPVFDQSDAGTDKHDYKTAALCKLVRRAVALALSGECSDPRLQALVVNDVLPAPNAGRLLVRLIAPNAHDHAGVIEILERLEKVHGLLRARVADVSARKCVSELTFHVIPTGASQPGGAA